MNELALFAGAGGGLLASKLLRWNTVCAVEIERYPREVLLQRQRDGLLEKFPIWDDVRTFDGKPWRGKVDIITGGFPCQDISAAGKGEGITGSRSGLWKEYARIIGDVQPQFVFAENSPLLRTRGLGTVLQDLAAMGYNAAWGVLGAGDIGANHKRKRMWVLAYSDCNTSTDPKRLAQFQRILLAEGGWAEASDGLISLCPRKNGSYANCTYVEGQWKEQCGIDEELTNACYGGWWSTEPDVGRVAYGLASRVDRLMAIGNGQVPAVAATAFTILMEAARCSQQS